MASGVAGFGVSWVTAVRQVLGSHRDGMGWVQGFGFVLGVAGSCELVGLLPEIGNWRTGWARVTARTGFGLPWSELSLGCMGSCTGFGLAG